MNFWGIKYRCIPMYSYWFGENDNFLGNLAGVSKKIVYL